VRGRQARDRPSSPSSRTSAQSYPNAKSVRGSSLLPSAAVFWRRADTRVVLPVEGWPRTRMFFAGIEREEETELRIVDQRSCGGASGEDERESWFIIELAVESLNEMMTASLREYRRFNQLSSLNHHHGTQIISRHHHGSGSRGTRA
jgi:hypothetical protein